MKTKKITRRKFVANSAAASMAFSIVPCSVLGQNPPSGKLNIAIVGIAGRGRAHCGSRAVINENVVALCDVDHSERTAEAFDNFPKANKYQDFRVMLDKEKNLDAVIVATPDHTHAVIAMAAIKRGKHVYCEKPLTHSIHEARALTEAARKYNVQTQMGNQGHSAEHIRLVCEWIADGAIGNVTKVDAWSNRLGGKAGLPRPTDTPPIPSYLDWDTWLGPVKYRPYHSDYLPGKWRGRVDFGTGAIGDMGCHILDPAFWALDLASPTSVTATVPFSHNKTEDSYPVASIIRFKFPARGNKPPVDLTWYDGDLMPPRPDDLEEARRLDTNGAIIIGDKGKILHGSHGARSARIFPETKMQAYTLPPKTLPRVPGHHEDWINACKTGKPASSNFNYGGPLTETVLLGALASRFKNQKLIWNTKTMTITNNKEANALVNPLYRTGWSL